MNRTHSYGNFYALTLVALLLPSCFGGPGFLSQNEAFQAQDAAISVSTLGEVTSGKVSATSAVTQSLIAPSASSIAGVKVSIPPGALAIDTSILMEESAPLATGMMSQNLGITLSASAGRAVSITADKLTSAELSKPMTLAIPLNLSLLMMAEERSLVIVYRNYKDGETFDGVIPTSKLRIVGNEVRFEIVRWGAYQPAFIPKAEESKAATVVELKTEEKVITRTEIQKLPSASMSALTVNYDAATYRLTAKAELKSAEAEKCYIEAYGIENGERHFEWAQAPLYFETSFEHDPERIYAKIKMGCYLKGSGLLVESTYTTFDVPADPSRVKPTSTSGGTSGGPNPCPSGNCPPNIASISFSTPQLDFSGGAEIMSVTITVEVAAGYTMNTSVGQGNDCWMFINPYAPSPLHACNPIEIAGPNKYSRQLDVHKWTKATDKYFLWHLPWKDTNGQLHILYAGDPRMNVPAPSAYQNTSLSLVGFSVTGTETDTAPPSIGSLSLITGDPARLSLSVYESTPPAGEVSSGYSYSVCYTLINDTTQGLYNNCSTAVVSSMWEASIVDWATLPAGSYSVLEVSISDKAQNRRIYRRIQPADPNYSDISGGGSTTTSTPILTFTKSPP